MDRSWFLLAVLSPFLWSMCNHIDKIVLEKYFKDGGVGALIIVSALASIIAAPFLYLMDPTVLEIERGTAWVIVLTAVLDVVLLWAYLSALQKDESTNVILYYQLVPIFGLGTGYLFLGETVSSGQLAAMAIVILGTSIVSLETTEGKFRFKKRTVGFMLLACAAWAAELAIFKVVAIEDNAWRTLFWKHIVLTGIGVVIFAFVPRYRRNFLAAMRSNSVPILGLNLLNEVLYMLGAIAYGLAVMHAPVGVVLLTETFQSIFVFVLGLLIAAFLPKLATESTDIGNVMRKVVAIGVTGLGTYLLLV